MKLRSLAINEFKKFTTPMRLDSIGDGLNVVVGPNEMGKTTLLAALRAALFEKYNSRAKSIVALQNDRNKAGPVVQLEFELEDGIYEISKRFIKKPYAQLSCPDGRTIQGDAAEDKLRELLDFGEPGSSGAKSETLGMWSVLWVQQGRSFEALALSERAQSNLHSSLESQVGDVLGGRKGQALPQAISNQLYRLVTRATHQPRGYYKDAITRVKSLESEYDTLVERRAGLMKIFEDLENSQSSLKKLLSPKSDRKEKEKLELTKARRAELAQLELQIAAATSELELTENQLEQLQQTKSDRIELKETIVAENDAVDKYKQRLELIQQKESEAKSKIEKLHSETSDADKAFMNANHEVERKRQLLKAVERSAHIQELQRKYNLAMDAEKKRQESQRQADSILVDEQAVQEIGNLAKDLNSVEIQLNTAATRIELDIQPEQLANVLVDGSALQEEKSVVQAVEPTRIAIARIGNLTIEPGTEGRNELFHRKNSLSEKLEATLEMYGVKSVDEANEQYERRQKLLQDAKVARGTVEAYVAATDEYESGLQSMGGYIKGQVQILAREKEKFRLRELEPPSRVEEMLRTLQSKADQARETFNIALANLSGPEETLKNSQIELAILNENYKNARKKIKALRSRLKAAENELTENELRKSIKQARKNLAEQEASIEELQAQRTDETLEQLDVRVNRLEQAIQEKQEQRSRLREKIAGYTSIIEELEGAGLDEEIEKKKRELELSSQEASRCEREVKVLKLLLDTLHTAENEAKERYLSPIIDRITPYLRTLLPGTNIDINKDLKIVGVVRNEGHEEDFNRLSMGTQEQIAVLVRLAFAEMLVEQNHPATVVLDDALVFSDDQRIDRMFDILNMVSKNVQIIVLTCREQLFGSLGGKQLSLSITDPEELRSA